MDLQQINAIDSEAAQTVFDIFNQMRWAQIALYMIGSFVPSNTHFGGDNHIVNPCPQSLTQDLIGVAIAIERCCIEPVDPARKSGVYGSDRVFLVDIISPPKPTHGPTSEPDDGEIQI
jgi:hypothetical protein